jgi:hypothetical protein
MSDNMYDVELLFVHMSFTTSVVISYHKTREKRLDQLIFKNFSWRLKQHEKNQDGLLLLVYPY